MKNDNRPKLKRRKKARSVYVDTNAYSGSFKNPMTWSIGGGW